MSSSPGLAGPRPGLATREVAFLLILAAGAWAATVALARGMAGMLAGVAALALAVATVWLPGLAPGLHAAPPMMMH